MLTRMTDRDGWKVPVCTQEQASSHCMQPVHFSGIILRIFVIDTIPSGTGGRDQARDVVGRSLTVQDGSGFRKRRSAVTAEFLRPSVAAGSGQPWPRRRSPG